LHACGKQKLSPQRRRFHRKQALQMPFSSTALPVKKPIGKIRKFSRLANLK